MTKYTRFQDIPQFTKWGSYHVNMRIDYAIKTILHDWTGDEYNLDIDPDFQRGHVWTEKQQIRWLEFFLRGGKSGRDLLFNHPGWMNAWNGRFVLVDGKQRLEAARRFIENEVKVFGSYYSDYTDILNMLDHSFSVHVNDLATDSEVIQWYIDLNSGGVVHTDEEINKAKRLLKISKSKEQKA